jgi:hypothetical protein
VTEKIPGEMPFDTFQRVEQNIYESEGIIPDDIAEMFDECKAENPT